MYRLGHRQVHHYVLYGGAALLVVAGIAGVALGLKGAFQAHTKLTQSPALTRVVTNGQQPLQQIHQGILAFQLPADWRSVAAPPVRYTVYSWAGRTGFDAARRLDIYTDAIPLNLAVNRLLPVQADGNVLEVVGSVSDNCTSFTDRTPSSKATGQAPSKWAGVNFLCDVANYERDVVATGSKEGINYTTLTGNNSGRHRILLVYTDNNASPDYGIFVSIVKSLHLV